MYLFKVFISVNFVNADSKFDHSAIVHKKKFCVFCFVRFVYQITFNQDNREDRIMNSYESFILSFHVSILHVYIVRLSYSIVR